MRWIYRKYLIWKMERINNQLVSVRDFMRLLYPDEPAYHRADKFESDLIIRWVIINEKLERLK